jgi:hypothetical protein
MELVEAMIEVVIKVGKEVLNTAVKVARSKPSLTIITGIVCATTISVTSTSLVIACGILILKTLG